MTRLLPASALLLLLAACGGGDSTNKTTTKLDAVEVEPGTISDSMIILDDSNVDGTAVDTSTPADAAAPKKAAPDEQAEASEDGDDAESSDPDAVPAPIAKKAVKPADAGAADAAD